ncbi:transcription factor HES-7-like [Pocillopora damicornis]|uniref:transcription factor HES-7-like n=1 Tax=Pocillopora damicornis TaxID=46731 RepID=UPI000F550300|nr:transcription factor HES-7-like [Pocillopora damicornis]
MESALAKKTERRQTKQLVEKQRRDRIKKSLEELASLIPEARKQLQLGHRLRQTKILQLVVDYIRSSQQERENFKLYDTTSYQTCCLCSFCEKRLFVHETDTFSCTDDLNVKLSRAPVEASVRGRETSFPPKTCPFKVNNVSAETGYDKRKPEERLEEKKDGVAVETTCKGPLNALKSLCSSISPHFPPHTIGISSGLHSKNSTWFVSDSMLHQPTSFGLVPQVPPPTTDRQTLAAPENQNLWRPWICGHDCKND